LPREQPQELEKLIALKRFPNVVRQDLTHLVAFPTAVSVAGCAGAGERLYDAYGPRRLMWAPTGRSSEPVAKYEQALSVVRDDMKFLTAEDKSWMLSKTIERCGRSGVAAGWRWARRCPVAWLLLQAQ